MLDFPKDAAVARVGTGRLGDVGQSRDILVPLASEKPIRSLSCEATTDV